MTRRRNDEPGMWQHVFSRSVEETELYRDDDDREYFLRILAEVSAKFDVELNAWILMGNHFHLFLHLPDGNMAGFMQQLKSRYAMGYNRKYERRGAVFSERYGSRQTGNLTDLDADAANLSRYIHRNAYAILRNGETLADYRWSSYRTYLGLTNRWSWLHTKSILALFGDSPESYAAYVEADW